MNEHIEKCPICGRSGDDVCVCIFEGLIFRVECMCGCCGQWNNSREISIAKWDAVSIARQWADVQMQINIAFEEGRKDDAHGLCCDRDAMQKRCRLALKKAGMLNE